MERFDRENLSEIPVVDSAVEEIPEGLVLLPAPRPISRLRTAALAAVAVAMGAGSILIAVLGGDPSRGEDERAPLASGPGEATLASADVPGLDGGEVADRFEAGAGPFAAGETSASGADARQERNAAEASAQPAEPVSGQPSTSPAPTSAAGGISAQGEDASTASDPPNAPPAAPGDQPESVLPGPSETVDQVGHLVEQVADSLPLPDLIGD